MIQNQSTALLSGDQLTRVRALVAEGCMVKIGPTGITVFKPSGVVK